MTLGSILRRPILDPSLLRGGWLKLSQREQIASARAWRSEAAATGHLEMARVFWHWEQEAKRPKEKMERPPLVETNQNVISLDSQVETKEEETSLTNNTPLGEVVLEIHLRRSTPCLSARMLQIANRLKRKGALRSLECDEMEGTVRWEGDLALTEATLDELLQKSEGVHRWQRMDSMGSSKMAG